MKVVIPGGSGQVGTLLSRALAARGHKVVVVSRNPAAANWKVLPWDAENLGPWASEFEGAHVVINLAGRSVNCRYTEKNKRLILESRVRSTRVVGEAIARASNPPKVWLQMSTATIYSHRYDAPNDDITGIIGGSETNAPSQWAFSISVAKAWEQAATEAPTPRTRRLILRSAVVMSPDPGGIFDLMLGLVRRGLGGTIADGRQFISWIHERDFVRTVDFLIAQKDLSGPVNLASPNPLPNAEFMKIFRRAWGTRIGLPASKWMLRIGTFLMRTEPELVLKSRRVIPTRLLQSGFTFDFPEWPSAAEDLCRRWKAQA